MVFDLFFFVPSLCSHDYTSGWSADKTLGHTQTRPRLSSPVNSHPDDEFSARAVGNLENNRDGQQIQSHAGYLHHVLVACNNNIVAVWQSIPQKSPLKWQNAIKADPHRIRRDITDVLWHS